MTQQRAVPPGYLLAVRSLQTGEVFTEGGLKTEVEEEGQVRVVCVRDSQGGVPYAAGSYPASPVRSRLLPDWAPFVPTVDCRLMESPGCRQAVYHVEPGTLDVVERLILRLTGVEGLNLPEPESFRRPDGTLDHEAVAGLVRRMGRAFPPEIAAESESVCSGVGLNGGALDQAWEALRIWYVDRGWAVEEPRIDGAKYVKCRRFVRGSEQAEATALSSLTVGQIVVYQSHGDPAP